jgi:hypothetical protein
MTSLLDKVSPADADGSMNAEYSCNSLQHFQDNPKAIKSNNDDRELQMILLWQHISIAFPFHDIEIREAQEEKSRCTLLFE